MEPMNCEWPGPASPDPKTIRLARGRHSSADDGACVMELASMLAGESFTDHPASVCPVIAAFLRVYNDALPDQCRDELLPYASTTVGTRSDRALRRWRSITLMRWAYPRRSERRIRLASRLCSPTLVAENVAREACMLPPSRRQGEVDRLVDQLVRGPGGGPAVPSVVPDDLTPGRREAEPVAGGS
jgi:hypothetical protein